MSGHNAVELRRALAPLLSDVVVFHLATTALGPLEGGVESFVEVLVGLVRQTKTTLVVPTFTMHMAHPVSDRARADRPSMMGRWVERLVERLDARSVHPTESVGAIGPRAAELVAPHPLDEPMGPRSPWARLLALDARIALVGVGLERCSLLHHSERMAEVPYLERTAYLAEIAFDERPRLFEVIGNRCSQGFPRISGQLQPKEVPVLDATARVYGARSLDLVARDALARDPGALLCLGPCPACDAARADIARTAR